jgi:hypothetical protein
MPHLNDPTDQTLYALGEVLENFRIATDAQEQFRECIGVIEGNVPVAMEPDLPYPDYIRQGGEPQLLREWCAELGYSLVSPDTEFPEAQLLTQFFAAEDVVDYYTFRYIPQMIRSGHIQEDQMRAYLDSPEEPTRSRLANLRNLLCQDTDSPFNAIDFSYERIAERYQQRYGAPLSPLTSAHHELALSETQRYNDPETPHDSIIKQITRVANQLRNDQLLLCINRLWQQNYHIICVFGKPHIQDIESYLEAFGRRLSEHPFTRTA